MKVKHAIALIIFGYCLNFIGALFKILHRPSADTVFIAATVLLVVGLLVFLYKVTKYPKFKDFLNS